MSNNIEVLLVGCGNMAKEYCKVLKAQGIYPVVVGRSAKGASQFREETGIKAIHGGVKNAENEISHLPSNAIIAVNADQLCDTAVEVLRLGIKNILLEKPAGMNRHEITKLFKLSKEMNANIYVAYNRRFYASTEKALEIIKEDEGVTSAIFEFTEWSNTISNLKTSDYIKANVLLGNSTHVIDLAFFFTGLPKEIKSFVGGGLNWHPNGSIYAGAGITQKNVMFSYCANWEAPGRWGVEILTKKHRLYFRPLEKLSIQNLDSVQIEEVECDDDLDKNFKPGLYKQVFMFLNNRQDKRLITIEEHLKALKYYEIIAGLHEESYHAV